MPPVGRLWPSDDDEEDGIVVGTSVFQDATWGTCPRYSIAPFSVQDDNDVVVEDKRDVVVVDDEEYDANHLMSFPPNIEDDRTFADLVGDDQERGGGHITLIMMMVVMMMLVAVVMMMM